MLDAGRAGKLNRPVMNRRSFLSLAAAAPFAMAGPAHAATPGKRKKGLGIVAKADGKWLPVIQQLNARWFYSWGANKPKGVPADVDFIPMIWGYWGDLAGIAKAGAAAKEAGIRELLGFNEPDQHNQSNLSVEKVLGLWPELMKTGLRLGSPGCVHPDREWMKAFMEGVKKQKLRVDYVCVHSYGGTDANAFLNRLESIHKLYDRPLWITEFACGDWEAKSVAENRHKPEAVLKFMKQVLPKLEKCSYVERYAWFPAGTDSASLGTSALFDKAGALTPLGKYYQSV
jgi:hypothetical protein